MVTVDQTKKEKLVGAGVEAAATFYGLSADDKPETAPNGSAFVEMDTSKLYFYDAAGAQWRAWG